MAQRFVTKSLVVKGKIYTPGLQELTAEEEADLEKRGAFEGGPTPAEAPKSAPLVMGATNEDLEVIAALISAELSVERSSEETPLQFLQRFAAESKDFTAAVIERADKRAENVGKELEAVIKQRDALAPDARLGNELVEVLLPHAGEAGNDEGAVEALQRIIAERDQARAELRSLKAETTSGGTADAPGNAPAAGNQASGVQSSGDGKADADKSKAKADAKPK